MKIVGSEAYVSFANTADGLAVRGDSELKGFSIAGPDGKFAWAKARIDGKKVVVWSDSVDHPIAVRYAWADNPVCNLYNASGLPAAPFRTDRWPGLTLNQR
jgi:sialate O-acetylesterase